MATTLRPRNGLILVQIMEEKEGKTASGVIIPSDKNIVFKMARVLAVGPGIWDAGKQCATDDIKPGQLVMVKASMVVGQNAVGGRAMGDLFPSFDTSQGKVGLVNQQDIVAEVVGTLDVPTPEPTLKLVTA